MKIVKVDSRRLDYGIIVEDTLEWLSERYNRRPEVKLALSKHEKSTGRAWGSWFCRVTPGTDPLDFEHVLMHEFAHTINPLAHHSPKFYENLFKMTKARGHVPLSYAFKREKGYKPRGSTKIARKMRIKVL